MEQTLVSDYKQDPESYDPCQISSTQEFSENVDVVWDWNSPQAKQRPKKLHKPLLLHSPKIPIKRHPSSHSIQDFRKLQGELQSLQNEIAGPENEESLLLSPLEEAEYKRIDENEAAFNGYSQKDNTTLTVETLDDLFDDSFDEQLVQFSQRIESDLVTEISKNQLPKIGNPHTNREVTSDPMSISDVNKTCNNKFTFTKVNRENMTKIANDSFDDFLGTIEFDNITDCNVNSENNVITGKMEFHRTKSFELSNLENSKVSGIYENKLQEIERKRKEALAKLEIKKKPNIYPTSPTQCSLEEIEQKRRQALAKREAKRQQEIIEQKRQEALKKLEMSRKKMLL